MWPIFRIKGRKERSPEWQDLPKAGVTGRESRKEAEPMSQSGYQLIDSGHFRKLEQVGPYRLIRPSAQAVWKPHLGASGWDQADAEFIRSSHGEGRWKLRNKKMPAQWTISLQGELNMLIRLTDFGHIGIFPEHHYGSDFKAMIQSHKGKEPFKILNLFAYTGAVSLLSASLGAEVVHVDASKTSVQWARDNAAGNPEKDLRIRWITDDVKKFVARELRRGSRYQGIILDPPSFGRGARGEVWKIEDDLPPLLDSLSQLMADDARFIKLSAHSPGFTPVALENLLKSCFSGKEQTFQSFEMLTPSSAGNMLPLPSGACSFLSFRKQS